MPSFRTGLAHGDLPSVELAMGYGFGKDQDKWDMATSRVYATNPPNLSLQIPAVPNTKPLAEPIRPARKGKKGKKRQNVFYDDCGFPDQSHDYDYLLHNVNSGQVLRKRQHPPPSLDEIDPDFHSVYNGKLQA